MENKICETCNNMLMEDFEFCPYCGSAITDKAKELENTKTINAQLVTLATLIRNIDDASSLYAIDKYIKKLTKKN